MYCMKCGTPNSDTAKFCIKCGQPMAQAQSPTPPVEVVPAPGIETPDRRESTPRTTLGSKIAVLAAVITVVGFFLPWATASCGGIQGSATGLELANGVLQTNYGPMEELPAQPELFLVLGAAGVVLLVALVFYAMRRVSLWGLAIQSAAATGGLVVIWNALDALRQFVAEYVSVSTQPGFIATIGGLIAIIVSNVLSLVELVFHRRGNSGADDGARRQSVDRKGQQGPRG